MAGRGDQYNEYEGYTWRTLDGADPQGGGGDAPNNGCQNPYENPEHPHNNYRRYQDNYLPLPAGWVLAPNDATSIAVVAAHGWSAQCAVLADGTAWRSGAVSSSGGSCGSDKLATSGGTYTVTDCRRRVLARCG